MRLFFLREKVVGAWAPDIAAAEVHEVVTTGNKLANGEPDVHAGNHVKGQPKKAPHAVRRKYLNQRGLVFCTCISLSVEPGKPMVVAYGPQEARKPVHMVAVYMGDENVPDISETFVPAPGDALQPGDGSFAGILYHEQRLSVGTLGDQNSSRRHVPLPGRDRRGGTEVNDPPRSSFEPHRPRGEVLRAQAELLHVASFKWLATPELGLQF
mmetsp:Transcript_12381/g.37770  ORF Transcript_12381/g.37770 Transcript_12381/m.37770 type:complete len:211 (-) Transcript_12381:442-1074(-)